MRVNYLLLISLLAVSFHLSRCEEIYGKPKKELHADAATLDREFDLDLRAQHDLTSSTVISQEQLQKIIAGAEKGNKDNMYYLGILKFYGITLSKDIKGAAQYFNKAASLGHADSQTAVGMMKLKGLGMEPDAVGAMNMFKRAAEQDNQNGYWLLGKMLLEGKGPIKANHVEAFVLLKKAASKFIPQAEHQLAVMYEYGLGVPQDFKKAIEYYKRAVEKKYVESMYHLALMYIYGRSGTIEYAQALTLLEAGALTNHGPSAYYMGIMKTYGYGTNIDYEEAMHWFDLAATTGDDRVAEEAYNNAQELSGLLKEAEAHNRAVQDSYRLRQEEGADL